MGLDGGGAGGGGGGGILGVGNPFIGAASALEIYGDFAAAYSGQQNINTSTVKHLEFVSGNYLFVGELQFNGAIKFTTSDLGDGSTAALQISFNNVELFTLKTETTSEDMPTEMTVPIIIPSYTAVLIEVLATSNTAGQYTSANLIGRIYRD